LYRKMKSLGISPEEKEEKAGESDTE